MFGRKIEDIDNDGGRVYYEYNKASQLVSVIDRNGNVISYTYDSNGQILTETVGDIVTAYEYDLNGNIIETADANSTISYVYDERNLPTTIDYGDDYVVKYVYDKNGNVLKVQTLGMQILYTYDSMNRIKTVTANDLTATYVYDKNGNATNVDVGDSVKSVYTFDKRNMPTLIVNNVGTDVISSTYTYNALGMQTSKTENGETTDYTYDALTRLAKIVEHDGRTTDYTYDKNGNRKTQKVAKGEEVIAEIEYLYNSLGRLVETAETRTDMSEDSNYKYDSNGNQIEVAITTTNITPATAETVEEKVVHNSVVKYDFNGKNQMTHSESAGGRSAEYKYYFNSLRSEKADTKFIYSGKQVLAEVSPDSENINVYGNALLFTIATQITTTKTEIPNPDYIKPVDKEEIPPVNQIAGVTETNKASETSESNVEPTNETTTNPTSESKVEPTNEITTNPTSESKVVDTESETIIVEEKTRETQNLIYNFNGHGDVVRLSNENGVKLNTYKYDAFGNITEKVEAVSNTFFYSGYEYDEETGLYYLRTRYYNPKTARFTTEDTFNGWYDDPLSLNKYTYVHNNPVNYDDPDGMFLNSIIDGLKNIGNGIKNIGNKLVDAGKKLANDIKEAFTPSKPEDSGTSNASDATSGGTSYSNNGNGSNGLSETNSGSTEGNAKNIYDEYSSNKDYQKALIGLAAGVTQEIYRSDDTWNNTNVGYTKHFSSAGVTKGFEAGGAVKYEEYIKYDKNGNRTDEYSLVVKTGDDTNIALSTSPDGIGISGSNEFMTITKTFSQNLKYNIVTTEYTYSQDGVYGKYTVEEGKKRPEKIRINIPQVSPEVLENMILPVTVAVVLGIIGKNIKDGVKKTASGAIFVIEEVMKDHPLFNDQPRYW